MPYWTRRPIELSFSSSRFSGGWGRIVSVDRAQLDLPGLGRGLDGRDALGLHRLEQLEVGLVVCEEPVARKYLGLKSRMTWSMPP